MYYSSIVCIFLLRLFGTSSEGIKEQISKLENDILIPVIQQIACRWCLLRLDLIISFSIHSFFYLLLSFCPVCVSLLLPLNLLEPV
jgi:hypothetical protein